MGPADWFRQFAHNFAYPRDYTTIDIETSGIHPEQHYICAIGHVVVRGGAIEAMHESYLNWPAEPGVDTAELRQQLRETEEHMVSCGKPFHHSYERLQLEGRPALTVLQEYLDLIEDMEARGEILVSHNGWRFDMEFLQSHFHNWLGVPFVFAPGAVYDTGIVEKAAQLPASDGHLPYRGETLQQFAHRIGGIRRKGVFWALDGYCEAKYGLAARAGGTAALMHTAGQDALLLHYLYEEQRRQALGECAAVPPPVVEEFWKP